MNAFSDSFNNNGYETCFPEKTLRVFDPEYRMVKAKERMQKNKTSFGKTPLKEKQLDLLMEQLVSSASGSVACPVGIEALSGRVRELGSAPRPAGCATLVVYKTGMGRVCCSVEKLYYSPGDSLTDGALWMENASAALRKFRESGYFSGVIGKGDFTEPIRRVFRQRFGYSVS